MANTRATTILFRDGQVTCGRNFQFFWLAHQGLHPLADKGSVDEMSCSIWANLRVIDFTWTDNIAKNLCRALHFFTQISFRSQQKVRNLHSSHTPRRGSHQPSAQYRTSPHIQVASGTLLKLLPYPITAEHPMRRGRTTLCTPPSLICSQTVHQTDFLPTNVM
jgi:hypothetical protein